MQIVWFSFGSIVVRQQPTSPLDGHDHEESAQTNTKTEENNKNIDWTHILECARARKLNTMTTQRWF